MILFDDYGLCCDNLVLFDVLWKLNVDGILF